MSDWSNYISEDDLAPIAESINSEVGAGRHVTVDQLKAVAASAASYYDYLPEEERANAILWDASQFSQYAAGLVGRDDDTSRYSALLASGHPDSPEVDPIAAAAWVAGAPELDPGQRAVVETALSPNSDYLRIIHANSRMRAIVSSGQASPETVKNIETLTARISGIPASLL
jgi:hypothetical protein